MCIACEMEFWLAIDEPPPGARVPPERPTAPFACDAPEPEPQPAKPAAPQPQDERKP
jgi:hypothetical protein